MNIIDELITRSEKMCKTQETDVQGVDKDNVTTGLHPLANTDTNNKHLSSIPPNVRAHIPDDNPNTQGDHDISILDKSFGFLNHNPSIFEFIGSGLCTIEQHLHIADIIRQTGVPNYVQKLCHNKFGFPLSIAYSETLHVSDIQNHASATSFPQQI